MTPITVAATTSKIRVDSTTTPRADKQSREVTIEAARLTPKVYAMFTQLVA